MPERAPRGAQPLQRKPARPKPGLAEDYAALEATLRDSPLGRWFLAEYARRNRTPETQLLLDAIARLEAAVRKPHRQTELARVLAELVELSDAIFRTRREIAQLRPPHAFEKHLSNATGELGQVVEATEIATSEILSAAEDIQEVAWTLRERGVDTEVCDRLDQRAVDIYTACSFQDVWGQRTVKVVRTLRHIEQRINAMIGAWGGEIASRRDVDEALELEGLVGETSDLMKGPAKDGEDLKQYDVDEMLNGTKPLEAESRRPRQMPEGSESGRFERPEPLTFGTLHAVKRAALFG